MSIYTNVDVDIHKCWYIHTILRGGGGGEMSFTDSTDVTDYFTDFYWLYYFTNFTDLVTSEILMTSYFRTSLINKIMF